MDKFRVVFNPAAPLANEYISETVFTYEIALKILDNIAKYTLALHAQELMTDYSNYGHVEQFVDGEWQEVDIEF